VVLRGQVRQIVSLAYLASNITETVPIDDVVDLLGQELATRRSRPA
jgi:hypothetical protein